MMSSELSRAIVDVYPSFTKWAFKWSTFSIISKGATHYCPPRGSFLKSMREGNQIPYYILTREMVLVWYPFDYMSDTFPQRRSTSTSFSVYVKTGVMLRSPSTFGSLLILTDLVILPNLTHYVHYYVRSHIWQNQQISKAKWRPLFYSNLYILSRPP